jgi:gliding motility-associated-like protein
LRNNAPGGIGNDLALDNISFQACGPDADISIVPTGIICESSISPTLTAFISADTGFLQWQISLDGSTWNDIAGATDRTHTVQQLVAGQYFFRYIYGNTTAALNNPKCRIVSLALLVEVVPVVHIIRDTLCDGLTYELNNIVYTETGTYLDTFVAVNGCDSIVQLELEFVDDPMIEASFGTAPASCEGANDGAAFLTSLSDIRPPYYFTVNDSIIPPPTTSVALPAGTYTVGIETPYGCFDEEEVVILDGPPLHVLTGADTTIQIGHSVLIESTTNLPVDTIFWAPAQFLSCDYCLDTEATPVQDITYVIHVGTDAGCEDTDSITIRVDRTPIIYVPNVFSPNGDQINDDFYITLDPLTVPAIEQALIFDRWGGVIARIGHTLTADIISIWDGETSTGPALTGSYVYLIEFVLADGTYQTLSGDINVIR